MFFVRTYVELIRLTVAAHRIYALYQRNKPIAGALFLYCLGELAVALWIYLTPSVTESALRLNFYVVFRLYLQAHTLLVTTFPDAPNSSSLHSKFLDPVNTYWIFDAFVCAGCLAQVSPDLYAILMSGGSARESHSKSQDKRPDCLVSDNAVNIQLYCTGFNIVQDSKRQRNRCRHCQARAHLLRVCSTF